MFGLSPFYFYTLIAVLLIVAELALFQATVFWFLFFGLGAAVTALVTFFIPEVSWIFATVLFFISSMVISAVLLKPLRNWQKQPSPMAGHDAIGQSVEVIEAVTADKAGKVIWSGTDWKAELSEDSEEINPGDNAVIVTLEGIRLTVKKA